MSALRRKGARIRGTIGFGRITWLASKPTDMKKLWLHKEAWLLTHDAEDHAYKIYPEIVGNLRGETTNDPASLPRDMVTDQVPMPMADTAAVEVM